MATPTFPKNLCRQEDKWEVIRMTHSLNEDGSWKNLTKQKNSSADISPTAAQMPRMLGLAQASKIYRDVPEITNKEKFSIDGNEISWGTIGNASTSEGLFFETDKRGRSTASTNGFERLG